MSTIYQMHKYSVIIAVVTSIIILLIYELRLQEVSKIVSKMYGLN